MRAAVAASVSTDKSVNYCVSTGDGVRIAAL